MHLPENTYANSSVTSKKNRIVTIILPRDHEVRIVSGEKFAVQLDPYNSVSPSSKAPPPPPSSAIKRRKAAKV